MTSSMYRAHRRALAKRLPDGLIFIEGGREVLRNHDVTYPFRQKSNFLYLTGIEAPDYALLLNPATGEEILFVPRIDQKHRVWLGDIPGLKESKARFGIRTVAYRDELRTVLKRGKQRRVYGDKDSLRALVPVRAAFEKDSAGFAEAMSELRVVKSAEELTLLRQANRVSAAGHHAAMAATRPGMAEYQVQAELELAFRRAGLRHNAYESIVAAGPNSAVLHYHANTARLRRGDFLLIDAGAECKGYAADITRTFPVSGVFSPRQRDIYSVVLTTQKRCISKLMPGVSIGDLHVESARVILQGLKDLRLITGSVDTALESGAYRVFYPHGLGHTLGLDVHDVVGGKKRQVRRRLPGDPVVRVDRILEPGFVVTMEPGLYFIPALLGDRELRKKYRGLIDFSKAERFIPLGGVRIEDDVAITPTGHQNLTTVVKEIEAIEAVCRGE